MKKRDLKPIGYKDCKRNCIVGFPNSKPNVV